MVLCSVPFLGPYKGRAWDLNIKKHVSKDGKDDFIMLTNAVRKLLQLDL